MLLGQRVKTRKYFDLYFKLARERCQDKIENLYAVFINSHNPVKMERATISFSKIDDVTYKITVGFCNGNFPMKFEMMNIITENGYDLLSVITTREQLHRDYASNYVYFEYTLPVVDKITVERSFYDEVIRALGIFQPNEIHDSLNFVMENFPESYKMYSHNTNRMVMQPNKNADGKKVCLIGD